MLIVSSFFTFGTPQLAHAENLAFNSAINLSDNAGPAGFYDIVSSGSNVYVVWEDGTRGSWEIFFRASKDNGTSFGSTINLSKNAGSSNYPEIAWSGKNVYVVWQDDSTGNKEIFFSRSTDNGATFLAPINLSNDSKNSVFPKIAVYGNNVYVVWQDGIASGNPDDQLPDAEILFKASTDNGATFASVINLSKNSGYSQVPQIAVSGNNVYVVWYDAMLGNYEVLLARSTDGGGSFDSPVNVNNNGGTRAHAQIALSGKNVYVVWLENVGDSTRQVDNVFFARSTDDGTTFSQPVNISNNKGVGLVPKLAVSGHNVYVVWFEGDTGYHLDFDVYFARSTNDGASFDNPVDLSNNVGISSNPSIAVSDSNVYVGWQDNTLGNEKVLFRASLDSGATWDPVINLSNNDEQSVAPGIALSGDNVYVAWMDNGVGNGDVLFTVGSTNRQSVPQIPISLAPITITSVSNSKPRWGLDEVSISGTAKASSLDTITVEWGDDTISNVRIIQQNGSWGPVSHTYDVEHVGKNNIVAKLFSGRLLKASTTYEIDVQKHATSITINQISNTKPDSPLTITGSLLDTDAEVGITSRIITFDGTGATGLQRTVSFKDGLFASKGVAPTNAGTGLTVQAHFAGDDLYLPSDSTVITYDTKPVEEKGVSDKPKEKVVSEKPKESEIAENISVQMKQKNGLALISVKNNGAEDVFDVKLKIPDGNIKFVKARGWDRERVDQSTVIVSTDDKPITSERSLIIMLIADNISSLEWYAINESGVEISRGMVGNK